MCVRAYACARACACAFVYAHMHTCASKCLNINPTLQFGNGVLGAGSSFE